ncbi:hypothetical protein OIO90_002388 [Microbotryomycetes sp. JL221]|nr:hypothetical protein OIO90_002388 [Microbotryomycetes sp. JL221]
MSSRPSYFELYPDRVPPKQGTASPLEPKATSTTAATPPRRSSLFHSQHNDNSQVSPRNSRVLPSHQRSPATGSLDGPSSPGQSPDRRSQTHSTLLARAFSPFSTNRQQTAASSTMPPTERRLSTMAVESTSPVQPAPSSSKLSSTSSSSAGRPQTAPASPHTTKPDGAQRQALPRQKSDEPHHSQLPWPAQTHPGEATYPSTPPRRSSATNGRRPSGSRSASSGTLDIKTLPQAQPSLDEPIAFPSANTATTDERRPSETSVKSHSSDYELDNAIDALIISNSEARQAGRSSSPFTSVFKTPPRSNGTTPKGYSIFSKSPRNSPRLGEGTSRSGRKIDLDRPVTPPQSGRQDDSLLQTPSAGEKRAIDLAALQTTPENPVYAQRIEGQTQRNGVSAMNDQNDQFLAGSIPAMQYSPQTVAMRDSHSASIDAVASGSQGMQEEERASSAMTAPIPSTSTPNRIKTIDEIVRAHAGAAYVAKMTPKPTPAQALAAQARARQVEANAEHHNGSVEELSSEATLSTPPASGQGNLPTRESSITSSSAGRSKSPFGSFGRRLGRATSSSKLNGASSDDERSDAKSIRSFKSSFSGYIGSRGNASPQSSSFSSEALACERELALLLKSPRLTRIVNMQKPPNQGLTVSYADVGAPEGHPVIVFLGLGSVRYLVALFDEMATSLGLRLICLDRWGLGRTSNVSDEKRGFYEWAAIVDEFATQLGLNKFSILAHSAGAPYALATTSMCDNKVFGSIHLLAPWVSTSADSLAGAYKLLKFVPTGVIKTAQAAEWKMQSWRLGKPPTIQHAAVGYNAKTGQMITGNGETSSLSPSSRSVYDSSDAVSTMTGSVVPRTPPQPRLDHNDPFSSSLPLSPVNTRRNSIASRMLSGAFLATPPGSGLSINGSPTTSVSGTDLANGLLRASHAESLRGSTADLMVILDRTSKSTSSPVRYDNVAHKVKVWHGDKDERISMSSIKTLETNLNGRCEVRIVEAADHNLMTNGQVMLEVLESLAREMHLE